MKQPLHLSGRQKRNENAQTQMRLFSVPYFQHFVFCSFEQVLEKMWCFRLHCLRVPPFSLQGGPQDFQLHHWFALIATWEPWLDKPSQVKPIRNPPLSRRLKDQPVIEDYVKRYAEWWQSVVAPKQTNKQLLLSTSASFARIKGSQTAAFCAMFPANVQSIIQTVHHMLDNNCVCRHSAFTF